MNLIKRLFTSAVAGSLFVCAGLSYAKASEREVRRRLKKFIKLLRKFLNILID